MRKKVEDEEPLDDWERKENEAIVAMMASSGRTARSERGQTIVADCSGVPRGYTVNLVNLRPGTVVLIDGMPVTWVKGG